MPFGNVFEGINSEYYQLTNAEKKVADYAAIHQQKARFISTFELAKEAGVTEATVSHFCKRLGYKGCGAFGLAVANSTARRVETPTIPGGIRPKDNIGGLYQKLYAADRGAMTQTVELIRPDNVRKAADLLFSTEGVLYMRQGGSMILTQECTHLLSTTRPNFYTVLDSYIQAITASHLMVRDMVLYFSYSGSTERLLRNLKTIRDRKAVAILVTRFLGSPGATYADVVLQCGPLEGPLQDDSVAARVAQLYLMDVLFHEVCRRDAQGNAETGEAVAEVLSDKCI